MIISRVSGNVTVSTCAGNRVQNLKRSESVSNYGVNMPPFSFRQLSCSMGEFYYIKSECLQLGKQQSVVFQHLPYRHSSCPSFCPVFPLIPEDSIGLRKTQDLIHLNHFIKTKQEQNTNHMESFSTELHITLLSISKQI